MNDYKVTVVVPVYNVEIYLNRCINSIINQTLKEIEIILVDDGSTDQSGKICDDYLEKDKRIKVIHQKNMGLSCARNAGIKIASADYICFIDSDDYIEIDMLEYLYEKALKYKSDIICCGFSSIYENGKKEKITIPNGDMFFSIEEALDIHLLSGYIDVVAWNKLYKTSLFDKIKYPDGMLYEDMLTTYKLISQSKLISLHPDSKYFYCKRKNSIGGTDFSEKTLKLVDACDQVLKYVLNKYPHLENIRVSKIQWYIVVLNKMITANKVDKEFVKKIKKMIARDRKIILRNKYLNSMRKCQILLLLVNYKVYELFYKKFILKYR